MSASVNWTTPSSAASTRRTTPASITATAARFTSASVGDVASSAYGVGLRYASDTAFALKTCATAGHAAASTSSCTARSASSRFVRPVRATLVFSAAGSNVSTHFASLVLEPLISFGPGPMAGSSSASFASSSPMV
ncbi:hypothetical protein PF005_g33221, partial [Phytophthora fragariae]